MMELNPAGEILEITFDHDDAHMALCHKVQGYGANGRPEALLIKSEEELSEDVVKDIDFIKAASEVTITTSMFTFLRKWMDLYWDDADTLARLLGYEGDGGEVSDYIAERMEGVTLLKADLPEKLTEEHVKELEDFMKSVDLNKDSFSEGDSEMKTQLEKADKPSEEKPNNPQGVLMSDTDKEKLEKATSSLEAKVADLEKQAAADKADKEALEGRVAAFEKAEADRTQKAFEAMTAGYSFITDEEKADFAKSLIELDGAAPEVAEVIVSALNKAQAAVDAIDEAQGSDDAAGIDLEKSENSSLKNLILDTYGDKV